jgi:hypothetical protein
MSKVESAVTAVDQQIKLTLRSSYLPSRRVPCPMTKVVHLQNPKDLVPVSHAGQASG